MSDVEEPEVCASGDHSEGLNKVGMPGCADCSHTSQYLRDDLGHAFVGDFVVVCNEEDCEYGHSTHTNSHLAAASLQDHQNEVEGQHDAAIREVNGSSDIPLT